MKQYLKDSLIYHIYGDTHDKIIDDLFNQITDSETYLREEKPATDEIHEIISNIRILAQYIFDLLEMIEENSFMTNKHKKILNHVTLILNK